MLLITCPFGLSSLLTTELKRLDMATQDTFPTGCRVTDSSRETIIRSNLHSRIANKVFAEIDAATVTTFDELFETVHAIDRSQHIHPGQAFRVLATSKHSILHAERTLQSITHKAIVTQLTGSRDAERVTDATQPQLDIYLYLDNNHAHILKNTSGESLHKRGWRQDAGEAPIKESLAVATLLLASRPFSQTLRDPCCGSGTLLIEAARLAKNIAPGRDRSFAFQSFPGYPEELFVRLHQKARDQEYSKSWTIIGSDIDPAVLSIAQRNAQAAGVGNIITRQQHDLLDPVPNAIHGPTTLITNPPYGQRLVDYDVQSIHTRLAELIQQPDRNGAIISGRDDALETFPLKHWKRKETRQGKEVCYIRVEKQK